MSLYTSTYNLVRYKISDLNVGTYDINFCLENGMVQRNIVSIEEFCDGDKLISDLNKYKGQKLIKFLDNKGCYRFISFNSFWEEVVESNSFLSNKIFTSIYTGQSNKNNLGYKSTKKIVLTRENVSDNMLDKIKDLYVSQKVYLYVSENNTDNNYDWVEVLLEGDGITRRKKGKFSKLTVTITLPEQYNINKL